GFSSAVAGAGSSQPAVAIKEPKVGEKVSKYARPQLNIELLWAELENSFRATRKFRVLSRNKEVIQEIREEQNFAQSDLAKGDAASTGDMSNAHYLILPKVQNFKFYRSSKILPNFDDKYRRTDSGLLHMSAQMVDSSTGQVVSTFDLKSSFQTKPEVVNRKGGIPNNTHFTKMAKQVAAQLANQFIDAVYPMKVLKRTRRNQVILNRGKDGGLKKGQKFEVFFAGDALIDPDTGESLATVEELVGTIEIVRINPKVSYAKIVSEIDSENAPIGEGDIVRAPQ
ncbi:MAG: FlgT C-terminal domain-containing protein, partial [Candidatus Thiodiazotropha sp.]